MVQLSDYILDVQALLRDSQSQFTTQQMLIRYINEARNQTAKRTACLSVLVTGQSPFGTSAQPGNAIPGAFVPGMLPGSNANNLNSAGATATSSNGFQTIPGVELYSYSFANPYLQGQYTGYHRVIYVSNISISWGGAVRPTLNWMPWDDLQALCRSYSPGTYTYPVVWSQKGIGENGQIWLFPVPINSQFCEMEWECVCTPTPLYTNNDFEALPGLYVSTVRYYAAYLAFLAQGRTEMAQIMRGLFDEQMLVNGVAGDWGHMETHYGSWP